MYMQYKWFRFIEVLLYIGSIDASLSYALLPIYMRLLMPSVLRILHVINVCLSGIQLRAWRHEGNPNTQGERKAIPPPQPYDGNGKRRRSPEGTNNLDNGYSTVFGRVKSLISLVHSIYQKSSERESKREIRYLVKLIFMRLCGSYPSASMQPSLNCVTPLERPSADIALPVDAFPNTSPLARLYSDYVWSGGSNVKGGVVSANALSLMGEGGYIWWCCTKKRVPWIIASRSLPAYSSADENIDMAEGLKTKCYFDELDARALQKRGCLRRVCGCACVWCLIWRKWWRKKHEIFSYE